MKIDIKVLALAIFFGGLICVIDGVLDYSTQFYKGTFWELMLTDVPAHEIYNRSIILASYIVFGVIMARIIRWRREAEEGLAALNEQLMAGNEQLQSAEQQLRVSNAQLKSSNLQLQTAEQQLRASNKQLQERNQQLRATEQKLQALTRRQEAILASVPDIIVEVDANKVYTWANQAGHEFFGPELLGREAAYYFEGEQKTYNLVRPLFEGDEDVFYLESWQRRQDGERRLLGWWCRVLKDEQGKVTGALSTARDITQQKRAELTLQESERRYRNLFENSVIGMYRTTPEGRILMANPALVRMLRFASWEELAGRDLEKQGFEPRHPRAAFKERIESQGQVQGLESAWTRRDGKTLFVRESAVAIRDKEGKTLYYEGSVEDITEQKRTEEELRKRSLYLRLHKTAAAAANEADSPEEAFKTVLDEVCSCTGWPCGTVLVKSKDTPDELDSIDLWHLEDPERFEPLRQSFNAYRYKKGVGIAGDVFARGEALWVDGKQLSEESHYPHGKMGVSLGIKSTFGFPVMIGDEVVAVLLFGATEVREPDQMFLDVTSDIGVQLGRVVERKRSEEALRESEERFRRLSEAAFEAIIIHEEGVILSANDQFFKMFGYEPDEILGKQVIPLTVAPEAREFMKKQIATEGLGPYESTGLKKDGTRFSMEIRVRLMEYKGRKVRVGVIMDITERKRAEEALRESEARYKRLVENSPDIVWSFSDKRGTLYASAQVQEILGYAPEFLYQNPWLWNDSIHPDDQDLVARAITDFASALPVDVEYRIKDTRGNWHWLRDRSIGRRQEGAETIMEGISTDVTEKRQAEEALRERQETIRALVETSRDWIWSTDLEGVHTYCNPAVESILGYRADELIGKQSFALMHEDDRRKVEAQLPSWVANKSGWNNLLIRWRHKEGGYRYLESNAAPILSSKGELTGFRGVDRDITERMQAEQDLRKTEKERAIILRSISEQIVYHDLDLRIRWANRAAGESANLDADCLIGGYCYEIWHQRHEPCEGCPVVKTRETGQPQQKEISTPDERVWFLRSYPIRGEDGALEGIVEVVQDITQRKQAEEEVRQRQRELAHASRLSTVGEMASGLAHELNQPLTAISTFAGGSLRMLESGASASEEIKSALQNVAAQAQRAGEIIRRIRDFTRKQEPQRSAVDINHIIQEAVDFIKPEAGKKQVEIRLELAEKLPLVRADAVQIEQVVLNLVRNGIEALEDPAMGQRRLTIQTRLLEHKDAVEVAVCDNGVGFNPEDAEKLFDSFYTTKDKGLGMGLSLSRTIIEWHDGHLWADANPEGGTTFRFTVPTKDA
ncbi:MAG: hypothetical protein AMJ79_12695 [Phycisphaerae bacterium SM23_30]|nr:MAG: hypothetical protein AMJ79_12695 [Phycisphaerae bacterium SM23_30]